jgi:thiol-disulfide isomerase/thioredoxin
MESQIASAPRRRWGRSLTVALVLLSFGFSFWMLNPRRNDVGTLAEAVAQETKPVAADEEKPGDKPKAKPREKVPAENPFPGRAPAPSLEGGVEWLNTSGEISLKDLRGKVVLLDFWTYCCINCIHILPDLKMLEKKYENQLVVIGVHHPKFENEHDSENIREAILRYEIEHPVVNDANSVIAGKFGFSSWPTLMLIDPEGNFVGQQPGEGTGELFDNVIGKMIAYHRAKGTLDETPLKFNLERAKATPTPLRYPGKVLADEASGRLFISDSNHNRIVISSLSGELQEVIGTGAIGRKDGGYGEATFDHPQGMALFENTLFVADTENHMLRAIDLEKKQVTTLSGTGKQSQTRTSGGKLRTTALNSPWALTILKGKLYVAMAGPHQLWVHTLGTDQIRVFAGSGREDILDGTLADSALAQPSGITHDGEFTYHVDSEGSAVRRVGAGKVETIVGPRDIPRGRSLFEFGDIDGTNEEVRLQHPLEVLYHEGRLFVADTYNHKIKVVDPKTRKCESWLGSGERGTSLKPVQLSEPAGLTIAGGKLIVADTNNHRLLSVDLTSKDATELTIEGLTPPAPTTTEAPADSLAAIPLPEITAKPGTSQKLALQFELPPLHKLNPIGKIGYKLTPVGDANAVAPEAVKVLREADGSGTTGTLELPLTAAPGKGVYELLVNFTYCNDDKGAVCRFGRQKWTLNITTKDDAETQPVEIKVEAAES